MTDRPTLAVIDVDGVVADVRHRLHHVKSRPKDWAAFFAAAPDDPLLPTGLETVRELAEKHVIVYLSGRPEHCRQDTLAWFEKHRLPPGELFLRPRGDFRPSRVMKVEMLAELQKVAPIGVLVDDDVMVVEAVREAGYHVLHADWMEERAALLEAQEVDGET